jgi:hypothetical protein
VAEQADAADSKAALSSEKHGGSQKQGDPSDALERPRTEIGSSEGQSGHQDAVETALADALQKASEAGAWDVVAKLAAELEARRRARAAVVDLDVVRARRGRS